MTKEIQQIKDVVIRFAGDSGDGIQLIGNEFTKSTAFSMNDLGTFPDYPAEIRAPVGTLAGVSGFQIRFGSHEVFTPGDYSDVLVVMNAAALRKNLTNLKKGGIIIANEDGFDVKNLRLAGIKEDENPLNEESIKENYKLITIAVTKITREALKDLKLGTKEMDRSRNMFILGLLSWMYSRPSVNTIDDIKKKFAKNPDILAANLLAFEKGIHYGETTELFANRFEVKPAKMAPGIYRGITGNQATALGLIAATEKSDLQLFYGTYPITPASDILHELSKHKNFKIITFQAEDEIAAVSATIGASYGGGLAVTASSGPGIDLKAEALGLAMMLELPLVVIDVMRAGPSTGMPTKTEQGDLLLAMFGRHGEAPMPILAAKSPSDCFETVYEAVRIAIEFMTPVFFLSDAFLANGAEPWAFPKSADLEPIHATIAQPEDAINGQYFPYTRNENLVRKWTLPGTPDLENRIGGIEKEDPSGNISYDPHNHERMVYKRDKKIQNIANHIPLLKIDSGAEKGKVLILGWGSTYGAIKTAALQLQEEGLSVSHAHLRYLNPFPRNLEEILSGFEHVLIPENNSGQLKMLIRSKYLIPAIGLNKIQGQPFTIAEIINKVRAIF